MKDNLDGPMDSTGASEGVPGSEPKRPKAKKKPIGKPKPKAKKPAKRKPAAKPKSKKKPVKKTKAKRPKVVKTKRKPGKPKVRPAGVVRMERLDLRLTKAEKGKLQRYADKTRRTITSVVLELIEKLK